MTPLSAISLLPDQCSAESLLAEWSWRVPENYLPILLSLFGDWFLLDPEGRVHMLDLISCELSQIAANETEFFAKLETEELRREWLRSHLVEAAERVGIQRSSSQCFAFRTPPMIGGKFALSNIVPWDFAKYQIGTSKVLQQVAHLPPGTQVITKPKV
jgi:T6SS immunity protein Tdi1, C-terminal